MCLRVNRNPMKRLQLFTGERVKPRQVFNLVIKHLHSYRPLLGVGWEDIDNLSLNPKMTTY